MNHHKGNAPVTRIKNQSYCYPRSPHCALFWSPAPPLISINGHHHPDSNAIIRLCFFLKLMRIKSYIHLIL